MLVSRFRVGPDIAAGTLVALMPKYRSGEVGIYAVYPTRKHVSPKVRALVDFMAERFDPQQTHWSIADRG